MVESVATYEREPTYHNDEESAYLLPNDTIEQKRLIDQHNGIVSLIGQPVRAPVSSPDIVLDIGCGTGIVTRHLSSRFPSAKVYGIDLSPVPASPTDTNLSNLSFIRGNFRKLVGKDNRLSPNSVDFVFSRLLLCGMTDWSSYVRDIFQVLAPNGWAEMGDYVEDVFYPENKDITPREDWEWLRLIREGGKLQGLDLDAGLTVQKYMEDAGFVDIQRWEFPIPFWRVPGANSEAMTDHAIGDKWGLYWHMIPRLVAPLNLSQEKIESLRLDMKRDLQEEKGKQQLFCVTIGRKPSI